MVYWDDNLTELPNHGLYICSSLSPTYHLPDFPTVLCIVPVLTSSLLISPCYLLHEAQKNIDSPLLNSQHSLSSGVYVPYFSQCSYFGACLSSRAECVQVLQGRGNGCLFSDSSLALSTVPGTVTEERKVRKSRGGGRAHLTSH